MKKTKIVLTGAESTGKSATAQYLAEYFKDLWLPEFARIYVEQLKRPYTYEDVVLITQRQIWREQDFLQKAERFLFVDTSLIILKVWFEEVFGKYPYWLDKEIIKNKADLYLLMYPDLPWEYDPVRENPGERRIYLHNRYLEHLKKLNFNFTVIYGKNDKRYKNAL